MGARVKVAKNRPGIRFHPRVKPVFVADLRETRTVDDLGQITIVTHVRGVSVETLIGELGRIKKVGY